MKTINTVLGFKIGDLVQLGEWIVGNDFLNEVKKGCYVSNQTGVYISHKGFKIQSFLEHPSKISFDVFLMDLDDQTMHITDVRNLKFHNK